MNGGAPLDLCQSGKNAAGNVTTLGREGSTSSPPLPACGLAARSLFRRGVVPEDMGGPAHHSELTDPQLARLAAGIESHLADIDSALDDPGSGSGKTNITLDLAGNVAGCRGTATRTRSGGSG